MIPSRCDDTSRGDQTADVLILGAGTAGLACAIRLAQTGIRAIVVTKRRSEDPVHLGESLAPNARPLLRLLGLWTDFQTDPHLPCYANLSAWGSPDLATYDFINNPHGHGWHIDRGLFDRRLRERALALGVSVVDDSRLVSVEQSAFVSHVRASEACFGAQFLIDATGRSAWLSRRLGARRLRADRHVAIVSVQQRGLADSASLVESTPHGWWYSAAIPGNRLVAAFMIDADLRRQPWTACRAEWHGWLDAAPHTKARICLEGGDIPEPTRCLDASSGRLDIFGGDGWLAVGDAALCMDPLSSHGLTVAMKSGCDAADAVCRYLANEGDAVALYCETLERAWTRYHDLRATYYRRETRWPGAEYWHRRLASSDDV